MSDANTNLTSVATFRPSRPFYAIWWSAISRPTLANYEAMLHEPNAGAGTGFWWLFLAAFCGSIITIISAAVSGGLYTLLGVSANDISMMFENTIGQVCANLICV